MAPVHVRLLGPPELTVGGTPARMRSGHGAALLAMLALAHPRGVGVGALVDGLWGERPPTRVINAVQVHVSRLRGLGVDVERTGSGYRLAGDVGVDVHDLATHLALAAAEPADALARARRALDLVRGPPLAGLEDLPFAAAEVPRLDELVAQARYLRCEASIEVGRGGEVLGELVALVAAQPADERPVRLLMRALDAAGRRADALAAYRAFRDRLVREHGLDPSPQLQDLHRAMLGRVPRQAPAGPAALVGRDRELADVLAVLAPDPERVGAAVVALDGPGGIGKTALALHVAHVLGPRFPDGVLHAAATAEPEAVLRRFLAALGVPAGELRGDLDDCAARFRTELADRRMLVVLDDARRAADVVPLLPTGRGCAALVTSRAPLGLSEAVSFEIGLLAPADAVALLTRIGRRTPDPADAGAYDAVAWACGHLPLALRIAGARLARPASSPRRLAALLGDENRRLAELRLGDVDVRAGFAVTLRALDVADRTAFAVLASLPGRAITPELAAAAWDRPVAAAVTRLGRLHAVRLIDGADGGYRLHDLLRLFGRELAVEQQDPGVDAALHRVLRHHLDTARSADAALDGPGHEDAFAWFADSLADLVAAARRAVESDVPDVAWLLADALFRYLDRTKSWTEWEAVATAGVDAAQRVGDRAGEASALNRLGCVHRERGRAEQAVTLLARALELARAHADVSIEKAVLNNLALAHQDAGRPDEAITYHELRLRLAREGGDRYEIVVALNNLGIVHRDGGDDGRAAALYEECRDLLTGADDRRTLGMILHNLADLALRAGRPDAAARLFVEGAGHSADTGDRHSHGHSLFQLGHAHAAAVRPDAATAAWRQAREVLAGVDPAAVATIDGLLHDAPWP